MEKSGDGEDAIPSGRKVLLFLGRIHPKKGLVNLLQAWSEVGNNDWVLAIVGWDEGGHEAKLKRLCEELGLSWKEETRRENEEGRAEREEWREGNAEKLKTEMLKTKRLKGHKGDREGNVVFLGPRFGEAKVECYRKCDAFILPSFSEGLPLAVLEAWSHGKPVLMTPQCNLPEGFVGGAALRISTDGPGIERGLRELMGMTDFQRAEMGRRGLELVRGRFNWKSVAAQMQSVCAWVTGSGPRPDCVQGYKC